MNAPPTARPFTSVLALAILPMACNWFAPGPTPTVTTQIPTAEAAESNLALTVYNQGAALGHDHRRFSLE